MSAVQRASGGDGWTSWTVERQGGNDYRVAVYSKYESTRQDNPSGWGAKVLLDEVVSDDRGRRAIDRAISWSSEYADRMAR